MARRPRKPVATAAEAPRINVLWLIKGLGPGGAEHLLVSTAKGGDSTKYRFSVAYVLSWKDALVPALDELGVETHCLGVKDARDLRWIIRLRSHLKRNQFDIIHVHSPLVAAVTRLVVLSLLERPPVVSTEHNTWGSHGRWTRMFNRLTFRLDESHIAVSRQVADSVPVKLRPRVEILIHGVDVAEISEARSGRGSIRAELGLNDDQLAICTVANLRWQKGYPDLLAAAKLVIDDGHDVVFLAVGQGPLEEEIKQRHELLGLGSSFRLLGYRSDAIRVLVDSDIFALASLHEGYPIAVMEAMVAGLPIVSTDAGGVPEAVRDGVEGFVVRSQHPEELAAALIKVITNPNLRRSMGEAATRRGHDFSIKSAIERTQQIYDEVARR